MSGERPSYWDYIRVEELLALQGGLPRDERALGDDEVRFITIHQIDELWFKLLLRELEATRNLFKQEHVPETALAAAALALHRVSLIFDLAGRHFALMETMRTQDYLKFRDKLSPASGFQSAQFREVEILMGLEDAQRIPFGNEPSYTAAMQVGAGRPSPALERVQRRQGDRPTLKQAVYGWLFRTPIQGSRPTDPGDAAVVRRYAEDFLACHGRAQEALQRSVLGAQALTREDEARLRGRYDAEQRQARAYLFAEDVAADERARRQRIRAAILFIDSYRHLPLLSWPCEIVDALIEVEQSLLVFRQRHARMVERVIGRRVGTGGSEGVDYLDRTALTYRVFADVWAARTLLLRPDAAPPVENAEFYGLRSG